MPSVEGVSATVEDYVKAIWSLSDYASRAVSTSDLADRLGISAASVSTMLKRLDSSGLVEHRPYRGSALTASGQRLALAVVRRHRILELFLATYLDIGWDAVHRHADALEHAASDELIEIIAAKLGDPVVDPHGAPIPTRDLVIEDLGTRSLGELGPGEGARLVRVSASDPAMLRYLADQGIALGDQVEVVALHPFDGPCEVRINQRIHLLGSELAKTLRVR